MSSNRDDLRAVVDETFHTVDHVLQKHRAKLVVHQTGTINYIGYGIARVDGLPDVKSEELVRFPGDVLGMAFNLDQSEVGVILFGQSKHLQAGQEVRRTGRVLDVGVGEGLLGRVIDPLGRPLDNRGKVRAAFRQPIEREAPPIMHRAPVTVPLQTGIKVIDATIPIGRGQRELILGDRQTGKTSIALDTILHQKDKDVICVYCAIGQRSSAVARLIADLREHQAMHYCIVVVAAGEEPPGLQFIAPYAATTIAEYFVEQGRAVLIVYDDLTRHAWTYRELSLLLRRPPGREAFPGDIFYIHSRLLERATVLKPEYGGGSLTALPIVETEAQNVSGYIPTNLISITDGQVYLSPELFRKGNLPAVDVGKSVSRVGGQAQLAAYRAVSGALRLSYSQFEELEAFARFGTRLDKETRRTIQQGRRVREMLKQEQYRTIPVAEQIAVLLAVIEGLMSDIALERVSQAEAVIRKAVVDQLSDVCHRIESGESLSTDDREALLKVSKAALAPLREVADGNSREH
jgi:F-type H+/Na+-transporting ATPase subunit alpha